MKYILSLIAVSLFISFSIIYGDSANFTFSKNCSGDPQNCQFQFTAPEALMESIDEGQFNQTITRLEAGFSNLTSNIGILEQVGNDTINYLNNVTSIINNNLVSINSSITTISGTITPLKNNIQNMTNDASKLIEAMICFLDGKKPSSLCY
ncbi:Hypothetical protein SRAE_X000176500 [Strongyloides ratti]|uniref:Uncharacterized protein n=1 Tax=Strongyloides ratti TaxID=34506 RepID=A0A090KRK9_STRRB|nr:Hypothetical protein SRAE_X000176500 [Strongyloides ratti]CEF60025.1 Hypothetical protein SRAE_X000176500 [Strongyloides ratti]